VLHVKLAAFLRRALDYCLGAVGFLGPVPPRKMKPFPSSSLVRLVMRTCDEALEGAGAFCTTPAIDAVLGGDAYCSLTKARNSASSIRRPRPYYIDVVAKGRPPSTSQAVHRPSDVMVTGISSSQTPNHVPSGNDTGTSMIFAMSFTSSSTDMYGRPGQESSGP
jgi:hypothetical protein